MFVLRYPKVVNDRITRHVYYNAENLADVPTEPVHKVVVVERPGVTTTFPALQTHRDNPHYHVDKVGEVTYDVGEGEDHDRVCRLFLDGVPAATSLAQSSTAQCPRTPHRFSDGQRG